MRAGLRPDGGCARAFTLIELLIVLAIIAVATSMVAPYASRSLDNMRLQQAAGSFAEWVRYAQALAGDHRRTVRLVMDVEARCYRVEEAKELGGVAFGPVAGCPFESVSLPTGVFFGPIEDAASQEGEPNVLIFEPDGQWSSGRVSLLRGTEKVQVRVNHILGQVEIVGTQKEPDHAADGRHAQLLGQPL